MTVRLLSQIAALEAENAALRAHLQCCRADNGHLRARLHIVSERHWNGDHRGVAALAWSENRRHDNTGFMPGGAL